MSHLLDTNSFIHHLRRGPASNVTGRLVAAPPGSVYLCSVVLAELFYGAMHSSAAHQAANLALIVGLRQQFVSLPFDDRAAEEYGRIRAHLAARGTLIGPNDLMIAAIALANRMTLVTHNTSEFSRVPGLILEAGSEPPPREEQREITIGHSARNRLLLVSFTERAGAIRIISARRATKGERQDYEEKPRH